MLSRCEWAWGGVRGLGEGVRGLGGGARGLVGGVKENPGGCRFEAGWGMGLKVRLFKGLLNLLLAFIEHYQCILGNTSWPQVCRGITWGMFCQNRKGPG